MPRAIFTFHLPREQPELDTFQQAGALASSLAEVTRVIRAHEDGKTTAATRKLVEQLREAIDYDALERAGF